MSKSVPRKRSSTGVGRWPGDLAMTRWGEGSTCCPHKLPGACLWSWPTPCFSIQPSPPCPESNSLQQRRFPLGKRDKMPPKTWARKARAGGRDKGGVWSGVGRQKTQRKQRSQRTGRSLMLQLYPAMQGGLQGPWHRLGHKATVSCKTDHALAPARQST